MENQTNFNNASGQPDKPNNNLAIAIVGTVLGCCSTFGIGFIVGIVGIVMATQVNSKFNNGDYEGAEKSAKYAKILGFVAMGLFLINVIYIGLNFENFQEQVELIQQQMESAQEAR